MSRGVLVVCVLSFLVAAAARPDARADAKQHIARGQALVKSGDYIAAENEYNAAMALARQAHDAALEIEALNALAYVQYDRGAMAASLANAQLAYRQSVQAANDKGRLEALSTIANIYADPHFAQYDRAIEYYRQLLAEYEKRGLQSDVADTLFNLGSTSQTKGDLASAELNYRRALVIFEKLGRDSDVAYTRRSLGSCLIRQGRPREALALIDSAADYYRKSGDLGNEAMARQYRGIAFRILGRSAEALRELEAAGKFFEKEKNARFLEKNEEAMALTYAQQGDYQNAYAAAKRQIAVEQTLATQRRDELSSRLRVEFDAEKKDQENRALARENALRTTALQEAHRRQDLQRIVIVLTALLAVALALLFWRQVVNTRRMRAMALTDELTRLPNRRHILAVADLAFAEAKRAGRPAAVIVFDIDRFKRINDTYGHAAGDTVLRTIARTCRLELRADDQLGRIGGEEFLVVLNAATSAQASEIAERLRAAVERLDFSAIAPTLTVTISLGVHVANHYDSNAAIGTADSLLYRAKESGRNRVEMNVA